MKIEMKKYLPKENGLYFYKENEQEPTLCYVSVDEDDDCVFVYDYPGMNGSYPADNDALFSEIIKFD